MLLMAINYSLSFQHSMLRFLAEGKEVLSAHLEVSLDSSLSDNISQCAEVVWHSCDLEQDLQGRAVETHSSPRSSRPKSITEVLLLIYSYSFTPIHLLLFIYSCSFTPIHLLLFIYSYSFTPIHWYSKTYFSQNTHYLHFYCAYNECLYCLHMILMNIVYYLTVF